MRQIREELLSAVSSALLDLDTPGPEIPRLAIPDLEVRVERPARPEHGDWSTNAALVLASVLRRSPREIAAELARSLTAMNLADVESVEVAGAGFVNFRLGPGWLHDVLRDVVSEGFENFARIDLGGGERVQVEFVSANPTGPLHVGNGWLASYGDALSRVLQRCGWNVSKEYYVNDTGGQIRALGASLLAVLAGRDVPDNGYQGSYIAALAGQYSSERQLQGGDNPVDLEDKPDDIVAAGRWAAEIILKQIRLSLQDLGIVFDEWYSQASVEEGGALEETVAIYQERNLCYEEDGALMLRTTDFGDNRDRVLRKSFERGGDFTYLAGDLAYHRDKFITRGFDRVIDVFGADHHGQVASLRAGVAALGIDPDRLEIRLGQLVSVAEGGEAIRQSKRLGQFVALDDLAQELGPAVTRLLSLVSSIDQATTVDLAAVRSQTADSPVYYVQYAHARLSSIERVAADRGISRRPMDEIDLSVLVHPRELDLLRVLSELPEVIRSAAMDRAPHRVTSWVRDLAARFHSFYHDCRVMGEDVQEGLTQARLWLVDSCKTGLQIGLFLLGVDAPESMHHIEP